MTDEIDVVVVVGAVVVLSLDSSIGGGEGAIERLQLLSGQMEKLYTHLMSF